MTKPTVYLVLGPPGTGKSYERAARWLVDDFLPNSTGVHYSNFPINAEACADYCHKRYGLDRDTTLSRIKTIDPLELNDWINEQSGPDVYFADREDGSNPLAGAHVAIDEAHVYLPRGKKSSYEWRKRWEGWLGTIRHRGCTVEFLTQDEAKVASEIVSHCETRILISSLGETRLPLIGIRTSDFYQILSKLRGKAVKCSVVTEQQKRGTKWESVGSRIQVMREEYYKFYDSFNATEHGQAGAKQEAPEWERFGWVRFTRWLLRRYAFAFAWRGAVVVLFCVFFGLILSGKAFPLLIGYFNGFTQSAVQQQPQQTTEGVADPLEVVEVPTQAWQDAYTTVTGISRHHVSTAEWLARIGEPIGSWEQAPTVVGIEQGRGRVTLSDGRVVLVGGRLRYKAEAAADVSGRAEPATGRADRRAGSTDQHQERNAAGNAPQRGASAL